VSAVIAQGRADGDDGLQRGGGAQHFRARRVGHLPAGDAGRGHDGDRRGPGGEREDPDGAAGFALVAGKSLGLPLPGETALIVAGTYAGTTHHLSPWLIFAAAAAAVTGDNIGSLIGVKGGYRFAGRYGPKVRLDERKLKTARYLFDTRGTAVVFFGRFVSILRTYAAFLAGTGRMRWRRFLPANASGGMVWAGIYTVTAYLAGGVLQRASGAVTWGLGGMAVIAVIAGWLLVRRQAGRLAARAEAAYPGPLE
jgi:membrane protein DedA with SNARE-associated domain